MTKFLLSEYAEPGCILAGPRDAFAIILRVNSSTSRVASR